MKFTSKFYIGQSVIVGNGRFRRPAQITGVTFTRKDGGRVLITLYETDDDPGRGLWEESEIEPIIKVKELLQPTGGTASDE